MSSLSNHLSSLASSNNDALDGDDKAVDAWYRNSVGAKNAQLEDGLDEEIVTDTVLDKYRLGTASSSVQLLLNKLLSTPAFQTLLPSVHAILSSGSNTDSISAELAELMGYDEIELVSDMLRERQALCRELAGFISLAPHAVNGASSSVSGAAEPHKPIEQYLNPESARQRMEEALRANANRPLWTGSAEAAPEILPHVYTSSSMIQGNHLSQFGSKYLLPLGTTRHDEEEYEEVILPPAKPVPPREAERLVPVQQLDDLCKGSFPGYTSLNRIQSIVYPTAYGSNENMLVCAPTGAGKTDVAMLTVLRVLDQHRTRNDKATSLAATIRKDDFKIIYVAPMKALAAEIVRKLGKRLQWLSIKVRELTGDMQLTKAEIAETQIIVTTPEKWDVVTRKPTGEGEIASTVKLLIIDEVHLLNDERGAVIETIVARTLRQVESSQSVIRIVGLSATLPNYVDVAEFLCVSKYAGLFYFDSSFRPVPLEQHFLGIRGKAGSALSRKNLDRVTYKKVMDLVRRGHQCMVFVHARKETVKSALALRETALAEGTLDDMSCEEHPQWTFFRQDVGRSRNKEMKQLFDNGFGIHHAGMLRSDRNLMERLFSERAIKVLVCTATLAWGVNLPAHAVIIKGTQLYDSGKGSFVDLSVLDVLQVFGRAGRPGLEDSGEGYICTTEDKLTHYLEAVTSQTPIESQFTAGIVDSLNAEIALGTVSNVNEAVQWLGYTYFFVRVRKNPFQYGLTREEVADDPRLGNKRNQLATAAARTLAKARMIAYDESTGAFAITDLGRIAAKYYIRHASIEIFNQQFQPKMTEADVLGVLSHSTEFNQIQVRESEIKELEHLMKEVIPCDVKGGTDTNYGKANILLQAYISGAYVDDFALVSDMAYVAQNGGRIIRALLEIAISRKWANVGAVLMSMSKAVEKQMWPFDHPLKQFELKKDVLYGLQQYGDDYAVAELTEMSAPELGKLIHLNDTHGAALLAAAQRFPSAQISYRLRPLGSDVLKLSIYVKRAFTWNTKHHGAVEPFWLWVENAEGTSILQMIHLVFRQSTVGLNVDFVISIPDGKPPEQVTIRFVSDRWIGAEEEVLVPLTTLKMPDTSEGHTPRLDLPYLSSSAVDPILRKAPLMSRVRHFNAIQTQAFWSLTSTRLHALLCGPIGSGKSTAVQIAVWSDLLKAPADAWSLIVVPRRSIAFEYVSDMRRTASSLGISLDFPSESQPFRRGKGKAIRIIVADDLLRIMLSMPEKYSETSGLRTVVFENLEQLDGPYELAASLFRWRNATGHIRYIGVSTSLNDPSDVASWLQVDPLALHSFQPRDRDQSLATAVTVFTIPHSTALLKAMAKPAHNIIRSAPLTEHILLFVSSRTNCRTVARDLLTHTALETADRGYLPEHVSEERMEDCYVRLRDKSLIDILRGGIGIFNHGMDKSDRLLVLDLYAEGIIRVLLVSRDACWTLPVRAGVVIVMGTQYMQVGAQGGEEQRQIVDYDLEDVVRMQGCAVRHNRGGKFHLFCQAESKDTFTRFLDEGLPLESKLVESNELLRWYQERRKEGGLQKARTALMDLLPWTFLARRISSNPTYYDASIASRDEMLSRVADRLEEGQDLA